MLHKQLQTAHKQFLNLHKEAWDRWQIDSQLFVCGSQEWMDAWSKRELTYIPAWKKYRQLLKAYEKAR